MHINGIHMHTGSDILDIDDSFMLPKYSLKQQKNFKDLQFIDFGSGFKVPYKEGDIQTNIEELGERLSTRFAEFCKEYGRDLTLAFEPGKFLVSEAGRFFSESECGETNYFHCVCGY